MVTSPTALSTNNIYVLGAVVVLAVSIFTTATAGNIVRTYTNYTVGGEFGWRFDTPTNVSVTDYTAWSSSISFFLGDFLIFNTNPNSTVIQTYNTTTYHLCSIEQDYGNLTSQFVVEDTDDGTTAGGIPVLLTREGDNYYFSSSSNGLQCRNGMRFHIVVQHGNGLPVPSPPSPPPSTVEVVTKQRPVPENDGGELLRWRFHGLGVLLIWVFFP